MKTTAEIKIIALRQGQLPLVTAVCQRALGQPVNLTHLSEDEERIVGNMNRQEARRWLAKTRPVLFRCPHCTLEELRDVETDESGVWHRPTTHVVGFDPPRPRLRNPLAADHPVRAQDGTCPPTFTDASLTRT